MENRKPCDPERQRIINDCARIINDINQYFCDIEFWNNNTRVRLWPNDPPIIADPDGLMERQRKALQRTLGHEATLGNAPTVTFPPVTPSKYIALTDTSQLRRELRQDSENRSN